MKRLIAIILALTVILSLAGCTKLEKLVTIPTTDRDVIAASDGLTTEAETTDPLSYQEDEEHELPKIPMH